MATVFISYSHKDEVWKDRLEPHLKTLEIEGFYQSWDDRKIEPGSDWYKQIETALNQARVVIMLISAHYLSSQFITEVEVPRILTRRQEEGVTVVPVIVKPCPWKKVEWLAAIQAMPKDGAALSTMPEHEIDRVLAEVAQKVCDLMGSGEKCAAVPGDNISLYKLPVTGDRLFGRENELRLLDDAWTDSHTRIVTLVAWGGVGKTALVNRWLNEMQRQDYRGAQKVFGWSFYSQGAEEGRQASADDFFQETLHWFGDAHPEAGSAVDKGRRLARLAGQQKTLLILDGLEPLQYPPGEVTGLEGKLKDAGLELLTSLGVTTGSRRDFQVAVTEYACHALALTLLGNYLKRVHQGDIRRRDEIPRLSRERQHGHHAMRVMAAYEKWFGPSPERDLLYILGLFDRPVEKWAIRTLKRGLTIPGVTDRLRNLSEEDWRWALSHLREARLLAVENPHKPGTLDCHPLVREHFGAKLRQENPAGWQAAHERLYRYFKDLPAKELPDTLLEMEPLFAAVAHGCRAGLHQEAMDEVYLKRIQRGGNTNYCCSKLGAFGSDLAALSHFFAVPWAQPAAGLPEREKAVVLSWAAFRLRALGRLREAVQPMQAGLEYHIKQENWKESALNASNLSELLLTLGEVPGAVDAARQSVTHADRSGDAFQREGKRTTLADALHQSGAVTEAEQWFREAEALQKKRQPQYPFLYSLQGYRFCDLLLEHPAPGQAREVLERAEKTLEISERNGWLFGISLDKLSLGRAGLMLALEKTPGETPPQSDRLSRAMTFLEQAVEGLRKAGQQQYLAPGLIIRAGGYRHLHDYARAWDDLNEARDIAELGGMKLFICDYHLEAGRLCRAQGKENDAAEHFRQAKAQIEETGYLRRSKEVQR